MDMIGRVKGVADSTPDNPMSGPDEVFVITGNQSRELIKIAEDVMIIHLLTLITPERKKPPSSFLQEATIIIL